MKTRHFSDTTDVKMSGYCTDIIKLLFLPLLEIISIINTSNLQNLGR